MKSKLYERQFEKLVERGIFSVSNGGKICRHFTNLGHGWIIKLQKPRRVDVPVKNGYRRVFVRINGRRAGLWAHRIVYQHFKGDIPEGFTINHEDGKKGRNPPDNLTAMTQGDNNKHAYRVLGTRCAKGEQHGRHKLTNRDVKRIRKLRSAGMLLRKIGDLFSVSKASVCMISRRKRWGHVP